MDLPGRLGALRGQLIVSCQALPGEVFRDSHLMALFARAAVAGGAGGIRANGPEDVRAIREATDVPLIGIHKSIVEDGRKLITPSLEFARALVEAGADMVALDASVRGRRYGALERIRRIREELGVPALADIATVEEALTAESAGADAVLSTMRGYTRETEQVEAFEPHFIAELAERLRVPVIAEGRIYSPAQARAALAAGAFAFVVGTAITRPQQMTRFFVAALNA